MKHLQVTFTLRVPETEKEPTPQEVEQWIKYYLKATGDIPLSNPLVDDDMEAIYGSVEIEYF